MNAYIQADGKWERDGSIAPDPAPDLVRGDYTIMARTTLETTTLGSRSEGAPGYYYGPPNPEWQNNFKVK